MQLSLRPISHPEFGEITIDDTLFLIGRDEPAFQQLPQKNLSRLSRRHARIFEQDGVVYIIDLNSRNGTQLNGRALTNQPVALERGDTISFANEFAYQVDNLASLTAAGQAIAGDITLVLQPDAAASVLEPMIISAFPFLISKQDDAFAKYGADHQREVDFLSRRHAHIFTSGGRLYLEDLGSTNGTFVNGHRLEETKAVLRNDDVIAFGGDFFVYQVTLERPMAEDPTLVVSTEEATVVLANEATAANRSLSGSFNADRTTFVTAATSFLDIFCADDAPGDGSNTPDEDPDARVDAAKRGLRKRRAVFFGELREALADENPRKSGAWRYLVLALLVGAAAYAGYSWLSDPTDRIAALIDQGEYENALSTARPYLAEHPEDDEVGALARSALIAQFLPDWLKSVDGADPQGLDAGLSVMQPLADEIPQSATWPNLLQVIGDLEIQAARRGGITQPIRLFGEEPEILERLLDRWRSAVRAQRRELAQLRSTIRTLETESAERFEAIYNRAFSNERGLRNLLSAYQRAADELRQSIERALPKDDFAVIEDALDRLKTGSTSVTGVERLEQDLANYRAIHQVSGQGNPVRAARLALETEFYAPPFVTAAQRLRAQLPPPIIVATFEAADSAWQRGATQQAIETLAGIADRQWQPIAQARLAQMRKILTDFEALRVNQNQDGYSERLLAYFNDLDQERDGFFRDQLASTTNIHREKLTKRAQSAFAEADQAWAKYQSNGKITSTQRLAASVSKNYRQRADELTNAYRKATSSVELYRLARPEVPSDWLRLLRDATSEIELQRRSLRELRGVVRQAVLQEKLALLPDTEGRDKPRDGGSS